MLFCCFRRNVEAAYHKDFVVVSRHQQNSAAYQRLVSSTCHDPSQISVLHLVVESFTARSGAIILAEIAIFAYPTCIRRPC